MDAARQLIVNIVTEIVQPIIYLLFAVAFLVFLWGAFKFVAHSDDEGARNTGKSSLLWGFVGMLIMLMVFTIIAIIKNTIPGAEIPQL